MNPGQTTVQTNIAYLLDEQYGRLVEPTENGVEITQDALARFFADLGPVLDERRRRLACGAAARMIGRGGIVAVSRATGVSRNTIAAGVAEIQSGGLRPGERIRNPGAGRKSAAQREPQLAAALEKLLDSDQQDAQVPLQWTLRSSYEIADELQQQGFHISPSSVGQLMHGLGYFAAGRARAASEQKRADLRDQYLCAGSAAASFGADGHPVISVRAGRKELADGAAAGEQDGGTGGWVSVGPDMNVVDFTVDAVQRWWTEVSPRRFSNATRLLICTDTFGTDKEIRDGWKYYLARLAHATGLEITVQRIPPGIWRWRDREPQYSYTVTLAPNGGKSACCEVSIDLVTRPGPAAGGSPHASGCGCRYTARPRVTEADPAEQPAAEHPPARDLGYCAAPQGLRHAAEPTKPKIAEVVAHNIARDISTRRLRPGARLPSETVALARFNVSRSSLREALRLLEMLGVIRIRTGAGGGPVVGQVTSANFGSTATFYYHLIGVTIRQLLEARCILEPALVRLAVDQADPVAKGKLRSYMNSWGGDDTLRPAWHAQQERSRTAGFHRALIETGNPVLDLFSQALQDVWTARQFMEPFPWRAAPHHDNDHLLIAQAILANDGATAESLMRVHMDYLYDFANAQWSGLMDEVIDWH
jgi:DNA-binding FadR family transcriptional regulator/transposase